MKGLHVCVILSCVVYVASGALVRVEQGWLLGENLETSIGDGQYYSFKGIPYARPPVGTLRFKASEPPLPWRGVRNALEHGSICPQRNIFTNIFSPGSEDCLFLNVYTRSLTPKTLMPVMVFIHGGGYQSGSGNDNMFGPDFLVGLDVVLVTINYRLGALGYLSLENEEVPGNAGMKDQVAALKWVQKNIVKFGGDPNLVTIFGESAGGASVGFHLLSPLSKGLFKRAILLSGVPYCDFNVQYKPRKRANKIAKMLGHEAKDDRELLTALQSINSTDFVLNQPFLLAAEEMFNYYIKMYTFTPIVEKKGKNSFLIEDPMTMIKKGNVNEADIMFGYNNKELLFAAQQFDDYLLQRYINYPEMFVPTKILLKETPDVILEISDRVKDFYFGSKNISLDTLDEFVDYLGNVTFVYDILRYFKNYPMSHNKKRFFYKFSAVTRRNIYGNVGAPYGITGAAHQDLLMYLFDAKANHLPMSKNSLEYSLVRQATKMFTNFAKYGNPTPDSSLGVTWSEFNGQVMNYMDFGTNRQKMANSADAADLKFWENVYQYAQMPFY